MNINSAEQSMTHYHVLHLIVGILVTAVLLAIPKTFGALFAVFILAMIMPAAILPADFIQSKWLDRGALLLGAAIVVGLFYLMHKL